MTRKQVIDTAALLALNEDYAAALMRGESWAVRHAATCESINRGEPEEYRRPFDGKPRKWCGEACPFAEGCVMCTLPENPEMARLNRRMRKDTRRLAVGGIIEINGDIDWDMLEKVRAAIATAEKNNVQKIEVRIRSSGGVSRAGLAIIDALMSARVEQRVGVVTEKAFSMAAIILQACDRREASSDAKFLIHGPRFNAVTVEDLRSPTLVERMVEAADISQARIDALLAERTGRKTHQLRSEYLRERTMSAREALRFGLIDKIRK